MQMGEGHNVDSKFQGSDLVRVELTRELQICGSRYCIVPSC